MSIDSYKLLRPGIWHFDVYWNIKTNKVKSGIVAIAAKKEHLKYFISGNQWERRDGDVKSHFLRIFNPGIRISHMKCAVSEIVFIDNIDHPKRRFTCRKCAKSWEYHQLMNLPDKSFSETFMYQYVIADEDWPNILETRSNGISSYYQMVVAGDSAAVDYFARYLGQFADNGFVSKKQ